MDGAAGTSRGLALRILGIPVRIQVSFVVLALLLGWSGGRVDASLLVWLLVVLVSILWHELGHGLAFRAFGVRSQIVLHAMGGHTVPTDDKPSTHGRDLLVSLAGPGAGLLLGAAALAAARSWGPSLVRHPLVWTGLQDLVWVNLWWSLLNLAPLLPLDGGRVAASLLEVLTRGRGRLAALLLSLATAAVAVVYGLAVGWLWVAFLGGYFGAMNLADLRRSRTEARERAHMEEVGEGFDRLARGDPAGAADVGHGLLGRATTPLVRDRAARLVMWTRLLDGRPEDAEVAVAAAHPGTVPVLEKDVVRAVGGPGRALDFLRKGHARTRGTALGAELARALAETGHLDEAVALVADQRGDGSSARPFVGLALHRAQRYAEAARLLGDAFALRRDPLVAYNAACAWARQGRSEEALEWLTRALDAGFSDPEALEEDPDLDSIRGTSEFQELQRRLGQ